MSAGRRDDPLVSHHRHDMPCGCIVTWDEHEEYTGIKMEIQYCRTHAAYGWQRYATREGGAG